jgi:hypothetical protein
MSTSYACADASARRDEPLYATGSQVRGWLTVEVRGPWGADAIHTSAFGEHVPPHWKDELKRRQIRAVCIRSHLRAEAAGVRLFACAARRPGEGPAPLWRRDVGSLADVLPAAAELRIDRPPGTGWERVEEQLILVCTNGRHDQCCANLGRPLVRALRTTRWADRVWECSHIGGDRFAANLVVLPQGLYFGRVTIDRVDALLHGLHRGELDLETYRGRSTLRYIEQAAEHFVRRELGLVAIDAIARVHRSADHVDVELRSGDGFHVELARTITLASTPLTCRGPADASYPTYRLVDIRRIR